MRLIRPREFLGEYKNAKTRPRQREVNPHIERRILVIREEQRDCCGEKIVYSLGKEGIHLSRSTVYLIPNRHLRSRREGRRNRLGGRVAPAKAPREVI
jgi:hypothetical protein